MKRCEFRSFFLACVVRCLLQSFFDLFGFERAEARVVFCRGMAQSQGFVGLTGCHHGSAAGETAESSSKVSSWRSELAKLISISEGSS